ncbi:MAG: GntR family transcriptional regulator [Chloroflexota bacterium]
MLKQDSAEPLYEQIKTHLLERIEDGTYPPHSKIPSERVLSDQFSVSRMTVKHAIKELVFSERLYTRVGKGTFVSEPPITQELTTLTSFTEDMASLGKTTSNRVLQAETLAATDKLAKLFAVPHGTELALLRRLRLVDNVPVALESSYLRHAVCKGVLTARDYGGASLYAALREDYGLQLAYAEQRISAGLSTPREASLLEIESGFPLLHITRVTFLPDDTPLEYVESAYRGDRYVFRARLGNL